MRKLLALLAVGLATLFVAPVQAADMPEYPDIEIPDVDYGVDSSFYLRGSVAGNFMWAKDVDLNCGCGVGPRPFQIGGYGYSFGAGIGYEFGDGLRADATIDYLVNNGLDAVLGGGPPPSHVTIGLRSTVALANVYYDFGLGGDGFGSAAGGFGAYVGAGLGMAHYSIADLAPAPVTPGSGITGAAAVMAGVTYDMGTVVADLGYRGIYMPILTNSNNADTLLVHDAYVQEVRGTVRYRFN
jgi:hypothetical protein